MPPETLLQPSPEQHAVIAARQPDPTGTLRVLAFAPVRAFTHSADREIDAGHLPPLPRGADRAEAVLAWARALWAMMCDPNSAVPLEHDAYLKLWHLRGARLPAGAAVLYLDEAQ